jgi:predicted NAD-dependent protein-ADP-ribosyltransferase YbiA (DUF1768 family)
MLQNGVVNFFSGKKDYRSLSNFWEGDIVIANEDTNRTYESGEHCFHGEKYIRLGELCEDESRKKVLLDYGAKFMKPSQYKTGAVAKKMGGKRGLVLNSTELKLWTSISIDVQHSICRWKVENYEEVRADLVKSGAKILIHPAMRCSEEKLEFRLWEGKGIVKDGKIVVLGKNLLGNIWMMYR